MKKSIFLGLATFAMLLTTSCVNEIAPSKEIGDTPVTFQIGTPEIATRAYSDGTTATKLQYAVYDEGGNLLDALTVEDAEINGSTSIELQLVTGNEYSIIFWAAAPNAPYTIDFANKTMTVNYQGAVCNDETRDAFYKCHTFTVRGAQTETIELKRPFAQLNIGTSDYEASEKAGYKPAYSYVKVPVSSVLNLFEGTVNEPKEEEFALSAIPTEEEFPVRGYEYISMNYLLVSADKEVVDVTFGYSEDNQTVKTRTVGSVPVQRNYRTNIYGQLFTSDVDVNVTIDPDYDEPANEADLLQLIAAIGGTYEATEDIDLTDDETFPQLEIDNSMILNMNGYDFVAGSAADYGIVAHGGSSVINDINLKSAGGAIGVVDGAALTFNSGSVDINTTSTSGRYLFYLEGAGSTLTINDGNFDFNRTQNQKRAYIYASLGTTAYVNGGNFGKASTRSGYTAGILGEGTVIIKGGTFGFDPSAWVADGYKAVKQGQTWYVVANDATVAATAAEVVTGFDNGGTVILVNDVKLDGRLNVAEGKEVYLDMNGKTITLEGTSVDPAFYTYKGSTLTITGNGTVEINDPSVSLIFPGGDVVIENGTFVRNIPAGTPANQVGAFFVGAKVSPWGSQTVTIKGGYFDGGYYNADAADIDEILAGTKTLDETADDIAKRGNSKDANKVRVAIKQNVQLLLNLSYNLFKVYGGTFVGANPAWGDEGCMLPTTPTYLRPWSYYQGALLDGQTFDENGLVIPTGYEITKGATADGRPTYTVTYNK